MTKNEIIAIIAERTGVSRADVRLFLEKFNETLFQGLNEEQQVKIKGLGTFKMVSVKARKSVNVNGGEAIEIPAHNKVSFTADKVFADMVNEPLAHLQVVELYDTPSENVDPAEENEDNYVVPSRMKKLSEDAEELKGLLVDINGPSVQPAVEETAVETPIVEAPTVEEPIVEEPAVEEPAVEEQEERAPEPQPVEEQEKPEEQSTYIPSDDDEKKNVMTHGGKMGRIFLWCMVLLLIVFGVIYWVNFKSDDKEVEEQPVATVTENEPVEPEVTIEEEKQDSLTETAETETAETNVTESKTEQKTSLPDKLNLAQMRSVKIDYSDIKGTETVRDGSRLTMISLRAYGDKRFWIYIFLANRDQLGNPGQISTGMIIKIPKIDSRLLDASNPDCLQYAKELESKYVK